MVKLSKQKIIDVYIGTIINYVIAFLKFKGELNNPKTIIIYKLDAIGDAILSLPMIKHLKEQTNAKIIIACSKNNQLIFKGQTFINKIVVFDSSKFNPKDLINNIRTLRKEQAEIAIDTSQSSNISAIMSWLTAKNTIGFKKTKGKSRNKVYNNSITLNPDKHMVFNYFDLLKPLQITPPKKIGLVRLFCNKTDYKDFIVLYPCTIIPQKEWPSDRWIYVMKYLIQKNKLIIIGSAKEAPLVKKLLKNMGTKSKRKIINLAGKTKLNELISIINKSKLFVGVDGGPMHIASCLQIPTIGLFGYETPVRYAPFSNNSISIYKGLSCSPCIKAYNNQWPKGDTPICMNKIQTKDVIKSIKKLI